MRVGVVVGSAALAVLVAAGCGGGGVSGQLVAEQDVPDDVRAEIDTTWRRFIDRFAARMTCVPDVSLLLVNKVDGGDARYVGDAARIEIEIPTTPARFRESLAHELAHHVEQGCPEFAELQSDLMPVLAGADRSWSEGDRWEETPSEVWAETVVLLVNGERLLHADRMPIDEIVIEHVDAWLDRRAPDSSSG